MMRARAIPAFVLIFLAVFATSTLHAQDDGSCPADGRARVGPFQVSDVSIHAGTKSVRIFLEDGFPSLVYELPASTPTLKEELVVKTALTAMENGLDVSIQWVDGDDGPPGNCTRFIRRFILHSAASAERVESGSFEP